MRKSILLIAILLTFVKGSFGQIDFYSPLITNYTVQIYSEITKEMVTDEKDISRKKVFEIHMINSNKTMNKLLKCFSKISPDKKSNLSHFNITILLNYKGGYHSGASIHISTITGDIILDDGENIETGNVSNKTGKSILKFLRKNNLLKYFNKSELIGLTKNI